MHLDERGKGDNLEVGVSCMWKTISAEWLHRVERKVKRGDRRKKDGDHRYQLSLLQPHMQK